MPNARVHRPVGTVVGAAAAGFGANKQQPAHVLVEIIGGGVGGWVGAAAPDWIDPATSPNHRHIGHGAANWGAAAAIAAETIIDWQKRLRARADTLAAMRWQLNSDFDKFWSWVSEMFLRFLAGALNGFSAGYLSHLVLDALTPKGLPLFARGF